MDRTLQTSEAENRSKRDNERHLLCSRKQKLEHGASLLFQIAGRKVQPLHFLMIQYSCSGAPAAEGRQAEPHTHIRELKGTQELIFSCVPWLAVLLVGAYARRRRRRRRRWSRATWRPYSNNRLTETCSLGLTCISLISDIHVMINWHLSK